MRNDEMVQRILKRAKRIAITMLCCIPVLIIFGYLTRNIITSNVAQIAIYVAFMGIVVFIVEWLEKKKSENKSEVEDVDVFK